MTEQGLSWDVQGACPFERPTSGKIINIPPAYMWGWSSAGIQIVGYCGENSMQSAAQYYGNWFSQETVFRANGQSTVLSGSGGTVSGQQLLLGSNDHLVAMGLSLNYEQFDTNNVPTPHTPVFLNWVKTQIDLSYPTISGWYDPTLKDNEYDHIMPIVGYNATNGVITQLYYNSLLYVQTNVQTDFVKSRAECNKSTGYSGTEYCLPSVQNFGIAITGNKYPGQYAAQLTVPFANEPDWGAIDGYYYNKTINVGTGDPISSPVSFSGTLNVFGLTAGKEYSCVRYDSVSSLPTNCDFLYGNHASRYDFVATQNVMAIIAHGLMSNGTYLFRFVSFIYFVL
jgi:hypothetical protein